MPAGLRGVWWWRDWRGPGREPGGPAGGSAADAAAFAGDGGPDGLVGAADAVGGDGAVKSLESGGRHGDRAEKTAGASEAAGSVAAVSGFAGEGLGEGVPPGGRQAGDGMTVREFLGLGWLRVGITIRLRGRQRGRGG